MAGPVLQMNARERRLLSAARLRRRLRAAAGHPVRARGPRALERGATTTTCARRCGRAGRARPRARAAGQEGRHRRPLRAKAPALAGYLEQSARPQKLEVTDSTPLPDVPHGKRYVEHGTNIHLKKTGMLALARFLESIEKSGYPVAITRLNLRKRSGEPDSYDVEVGVSSYDRTRRRELRHAGRERQAVKERLLKLRQVRPARRATRFLHHCLVRLRGAHVPLRQAQAAHRRDVQRRASAAPTARQELQIDEMSGYWLSGVRVKGVRLLTASDGARQAAREDRDRRGHGPLLDPVGARRQQRPRASTCSPSAARRRARIRCTARTRRSTSRSTASTSASVDPLVQILGVPLQGKLGGTVKLTLPEGKPSKAHRRRRPRGDRRGRGRRQGQDQGRARAARRSTSGTLDLRRRGEGRVAQDHQARSPAARTSSCRATAASRCATRSATRSATGRCGSRSTTRTAARATSPRASSAPGLERARRSSSWPIRR